MERRYLLTIALVLLPGFIVLGISALFLLRTDEFLPLDTIADRQQDSSMFCLYQASRGDELQLKSRNYALRKSDILAVGSSRALGFRQRFFTHSFYTASAGQVSSVDRLEDWVEHLVSLHEPKLLLLTVDHWWFLPQEVKRIKPFGEDWITDQPRVQPRFFLMPLQKLWKGEYTAEDIWYGIRRAWISNGYCNIGQQAALNRSGYAPDGSYYYGKYLIGSGVDIEKLQFKKTFNRIKQWRGNAVDSATWTQFEQIIERLRSRGIQVVILFPSVAPSVYDSMQDSSNEHFYINVLQERIARLDVSFVDALNATALGGNDCEFADGIHGGDVMYARILQVLYDRVPSVRPLLSIDLIQQTIERSAGLAMDPDPKAFQELETDFLQLGCEKHRQ